MDDMLDILHYLFESDTLGEEEVQKAKLKMRRTIYRVLYMRDYSWMDDVDNDYRDFGTQDASGVGHTPGMTHKPYIPPTPVNPESPLPYGAALAPPLG